MGSLKAFAGYDQRGQLEAVASPSGRVSPLRAEGVWGSLRPRLYVKGVQKFALLPKRRRARPLAELFVGETNAQQEMVASGHAEVLRRYSHQCHWTEGR